MLSPLAFPMDRIVDAEGRPLFEGRASKKMQAIAPLEHIVCPYSGSRHRHEKPMNISGLRQMRGHWNDLIAGLRYLRGVYPEPVSHLRYIDLWRICRMGESLPAFLLYRRSDPVPNEQLPANVASLYKVVIGLVSAAQRLAFASFFQGADHVNEELDSNYLYSFVEDTKLFIGPTEVCAGPEALIREVVDVLQEPPALDPAQRERLLLIGNEESFLAFSYCRMNSMILSSLYAILTESLYARITRALWPDESQREIFSRADPQLALLADIDKTLARAMLNGILQIAVSDHSGGRQLREVAKKMSTLLDFGQPHPRIVDELGSHAHVAGVTDDVARYLQLEKISSDLSWSLKKQYLESLDLQDSLHLDAVAQSFSPPDAVMRNLLGMKFGIQILPGFQIESKGRILMSLADESPWSSN